MVLDDYQGVALSSADWGRLPGVEVTALREHVGDEDRLVEVLADAQVVVVMRERTPLTRSLLERLTALRLVVTSGMRNAAIDLEACRARGVVVCGTASSPTPPVELTWALVLGLARRVVPEAAAFATGGPWQSSVGTDLAGGRLGLVGLGKIGSRVAAVGNAFGMDVVAWSPHLTPARAAAAGARAVPKHELFSASDVVSLHLVLSAATEGVVGREELEAMKPSAYLVNTARAGLVDTAALVEVLRAGGIAGAGLDVHDEEPLPADHPMRTLPSVLGTPHLGYVTERNYRTYFAEAVDDITAWLAGEPVRVLA